MIYYSNQDTFTVKGDTIEMDARRIGINSDCPSSGGSSQASSLGILLAWAHLVH